MASIYQARLWGQKAARDGIASEANPYRNPRWREAWDAGHSQELDFQQVRTLVAVH